MSQKKKWTAVVKKNLVQEEEVSENRPGPSRPNTEVKIDKKEKRSPTKVPPSQKREEKETPRKNKEKEINKKVPESMNDTPEINEVTSSDEEGWKIVKNKKLQIKIKKENKPNEIKRKRQLPADTSGEDEKESIKTQTKKIQMDKNLETPKKTKTQKTYDPPESPDPQSEEEIDVEGHTPIEMPFSPDYTMSGDNSSEEEEGEVKEN